MARLLKSRGTRWVAVAVALVLVSGILWIWVSNRRGGQGLLAASEPVASGQAAVLSDVSAQELETVVRVRVFFGHQSVGMNVLDGVSAVYAAHGIAVPRVERTRSPLRETGSWIAQDYLGANEKPLLKIQDFDDAMRGGLASQVQVAMMKLCYVDITSDTDVDTLFSTYRKTLSALERDFPGVTFIKVTVPLTTEQSGLSKLKAGLTGNDRFGAGENAVRERLNALIRKQYADDHLWDLAAIESTTPSGSRVEGQFDGKRYYALYDGYASDVGHLNAEGSRRAAVAWIKAIAEAKRTSVAPR
jgi:hypothetical protein